MNYGEGIVRDWEHEELKSAFFDESETISRIVLDTIAETDLEPTAAAWSSASRAC